MTRAMFIIAVLDEAFCTILKSKLVWKDKPVAEENIEDYLGPDIIQLGENIYDYLFSEDRERIRKSFDGAGLYRLDCDLVVKSSPDPKTNFIDVMEFELADINVVPLYNWDHHNVAEGKLVNMGASNNE